MRTATQMADAVLGDMRKHVNLTLWMVAVRRRLVEETDPAKRQLLAEMLVEINNRLPERKV